MRRSRSPEARYAVPCGRTRHYVGGIGTVVAETGRISCGSRSERWGENEGSGTVGIFGSTNPFIFSAL